MNYISYQEFIQDIKEFCYKLPQNIGYVEGVPRSGLIPASMIALHFNCGLETDDEKGPEGGLRYLKRKYPDDAINLYVDDSINQGNAFIRRYKDPLPWNHSFIKTAVIYATPEGSNKVDYYHKIIPAPRIFEWNIFNSWAVENACVDMDGVICDDYPRQDRDDDHYRKFLETVKPKIPITYPIQKIVTSRRQKYRPQTESWLKQHGIKYKDLVMYPDDKPRPHEHVAMWKAQVYANSKAKLFIESSAYQARMIYSFCNLPVFNVEENRMIS